MARRFDEVAVGDTIGSREIPVERPTLVQYAGASGDRNRIHWDERFAREVGLPDVIAHGMFTMGAAAELVSDWAGDGGRVRSYGAKFAGMVPVPYDGGTRIAVTGKVTGLDDAARTATVDLTVTCDEAKVLGRTRVVVALD